MDHVDDIARRPLLRPPPPDYAPHKHEPGPRPFIDERLLPRRGDPYRHDPRHNTRYDPGYADDLEDFDEDDSDDWERDPYPSYADEEYYEDSEFGDQSFERHDPRRLRFREPSFPPYGEREIYGRRQRMYQDPYDAYRGAYDPVPRPYPRDDYYTGRYHDDGMSSATPSYDDDSY